MHAESSRLQGQQWRESLAQDGFIVMPQVLDQPFLSKIQGRINERKLAEGPRENFGAAGAFLKLDYRDSILSKLLAYPRTLHIFMQLGYSHPKLHSYYISTKPPGAEALPWHADLFYPWDKAEPAELFLIYYLQNTSSDNGCLRVVSGSHRWSRTKQARFSGEVKKLPDEVDVPVQAGDLFIGDRRLLHATHANKRDQWRSCITIAYAPDFAHLPEPLQAMIIQNQCLPSPDWQRTSEAAIIDPKLQAILPI